MGQWFVQSVRILQKGLKVTTMTKEIRRISNYRKDDKRLVCSEVLLENGKTAYELVIIDEHEYHVKGRSVGRLPYSKIFMDKRQANRYAMAIIKKEGYIRI